MMGTAERELAQQNVDFNTRRDEGAFTVERTTGTRSSDKTGDNISKKKKRGGERVREQKIADRGGLPWG